MMILEKLNLVLSGKALPILIILVGIYFAVRLRFFFLLHPVKFARDLKKAGEGSGTSPFKALTVALAGTLGVGNISGVASAICSGGAGAVFWMWVSAFAAMSVKYVEVFLSVKYRRERGCGDKKEYYGGASYYIKDGLAPFVGKKRAFRFAVFFSVLLVTNSLVTGNIVQVNAASGITDKIPPLAVGAAFALLLCLVILGGAKRVGNFAISVIPLLSAAYLLLSFIIIIRDFSRVGEVFGRIFSDALDLRAAGGGAVGFGVSEAVRFGVTRGVFSNEAGCGTAPTAHASAHTKSPHHQGCFGIFEVFCDTVVLCTLTALVILLAGLDERAAIPLAIASYGVYFGRAGEIFIGVSVAVFALATVICQTYYGIEALSFISRKSAVKYVYLSIACVCAAAGSVMTQSFMWQAADLQISVMTIVNTLAVFVMSDEVFADKKYRAPERGARKKVEMNNQSR